MGTILPYDPETSTPWLWYGMGIAGITAIGYCTSRCMALADRIHHYANEARDTLFFYATPTDERPQRPVAIETPLTRGAPLGQLIRAAASNLLRETAESVSDHIVEQLQPAQPSSAEPRPGLRPVLLNFLKEKGREGAQALVDGAKEKLNEHLPHPTLETAAEDAIPGAAATPVETPPSLVTLVGEVATAAAREAVSGVITGAKAALGIAPNPTPSVSAGEGGVSAAVSPDEPTTFLNRCQKWLLAMSQTASSEAQKALFASGIKGITYALEMMKESIAAKMQAANMENHSAAIADLAESIKSFNEAAKDGNYINMRGSLSRFITALPQIYINGMSVPLIFAENLHAPIVEEKLENVGSLNRLAETFIPTDGLIEFDPDKPQIADTTTADIHFQKDFLSYNYSSQLLINYLLVKVLKVEIKPQDKVDLLQLPLQQFLKAIYKLIDTSKRGFLIKFTIKFFFKTIHYALWSFAKMVVNKAEKKLDTLLSKEEGERGFLFQELSHYFAILNGAYEAAAKEETVCGDLSKTLCEKIDKTFERRHIDPENLYRQTARKLCREFYPQVSWTRSFHAALNAYNPFEIPYLNPFFNGLKEMTKWIISPMIFPFEFLTNGLFRFLTYFLIERTKVIEKGLKNFVQFASNQRNLFRPVNSVINDQLQSLWLSLQRGYKEETKTAEEKRNLGLLATPLETMLREFFQVLEKSHILTQGELKEHSSLLETMLFKRTSAFLLPYSLEASTFLVSAISEKLLTDEKKKLIVCKILMNLNKRYRETPQDKPDDASVTEAEINRLISMILTHVLKKIISEKFVFKPVTQEKLTQEFFASQKDKVLNFAKALASWVETDRDLITRKDTTQRVNQTRALIALASEFQNNDLKDYFDRTAEAALPTKAQNSIDREYSGPLTKKMTRIVSLLETIKNHNDFLAAFDAKASNELCVARLQSLCRDFNPVSMESYNQFVDTLFPTVNREHTAFPLFNEINEDFKNRYNLIQVRNSIIQLLESKESDKNGIQSRIDEILGSQLDLLSDGDEKDRFRSFLLKIQSDISLIEEGKVLSTLQGLSQSRDWATVLKGSSTWLDSNEEAIKQKTAILSRLLNEEGSYLLNPQLLTTSYWKILDLLEQESKTLCDLVTTMNPTLHVNFEVGDLTFMTEYLQKLAFSSIQVYIAKIMKFAHASYNYHYLSLKLCELYLTI